MIKDDLIEIEKVTHFNDYKVKTYAIYEDEMNLIQNQEMFRVCQELCTSQFLFNFENSFGYISSL